MSHQTKSFLRGLILGLMIVIVMRVMQGEFTKLVTLIALVGVIVGYFISERVFKNKNNNQ